jgi:hypothetical protein
MLILKKNKYEQLVQLITYIQSFYPVKRYQLSEAYNKLERWIDDNSSYIRPENLIDGKIYGIIEYNKMSYAYAKKNGKELMFHGDIYSSIWHWNASKQIFWCENAWGQTYEKQLSSINKPLIEYP